MTSYYLGVDVGATKSHAILINDAGEIVGFGKAGTGNHEQVGFDGQADILNAITDEALAQAGLVRAQIAGAGFGLCGYDWASERAPHLGAVGAIGLNAPVEIVNDAVIGLIAGAEQGWGVCVIAGTSCNCWGRDSHGRQGHVVGMGQMMGEAGGGSELVQRALWAVGYEYSQIGKPTGLTQAFMEHVGAASAEALIEGYTEGRYRLSSREAPLVFRVAEAGDAVAQALVRWVGTELGNLALGVIRQLKLQNEAFDLVMAGNFYRGSPMITEALETCVWQEAPGAQLVRLHSPPVIGGALLGMEIAGCSFGLIAAARRSLVNQPVID